jgi:hypothetical protein
MARITSSIVLAAVTSMAVAHRAAAQAEPIFFTVPASTVGTHFEFTNTAGAGGFTQFSLFGAATHADVPPFPLPPALHTLVIVFEWRIAGGPVHDSTNWGESPDFISTVVGGTTNPFSTGVFTTPGAWDTVAVHLYAGFPITVSATFDHSWVVPSPSTLALFGVVGLRAARRRR